MNNTCPKCGKKLSPFYLKQNCPYCQVDLLYYQLEERLEADAAESQRQEENLKRYTDTLRASAAASPLLIVRLVLFFTPLGTMCLPMLQGVTLISLITGIIKGTFDFSSQLLPTLNIVLVIVLSLAVIISSLFSATRHGLRRNLIFSGINTAVLIGLGIAGGGFGIGWVLTLVIYALELLLHFLCDRVIRSKSKQ